MIYLCEDGSAVNTYKYDNAPISNIRYNGDKFQVDANLNSTGTLAFVGGCVVGAALTYIILKEINKK